MIASGTDGRPGPGAPARAPLRDAFRDALRYWERGRIGYNAALAGVTLAWLVLTWPHFRPALTLQSLLLCLVLAGIANVCYCAAYPIDIAAQRSPLGPAWRRRRWVLWCAGVLLACLLACYWIADEIYPGVS